MPKKIAPEMFSEMIALGHVVPRSGPMDFTMPTAYRSVPTELAYDTPMAPTTNKVHVDAQLERSTRRNKQSLQKRPVRRSR